MNPKSNNSANNGLPLTFANRIKSANRILVSNPGGIGDDLHLLPALHAIHKTAPSAQIDLLSSHGSASILKEIEYVNHVLTVKFPPLFRDKKEKARTRWAGLQVIWRHHYDAWIDFRPSDQTQLLGAFSFAKERLGIKCMYWRMKRDWLYSELIQREWHNEPSYRFLLNNLADAGFDISNTALTPDLLPKSIQPLPDLIGCIHVSLYTSAPCRELPSTSNRELIEKLCAIFPDRQILVTCADTEREKKLLAEASRGIDAPNLTLAAGKFCTLDILKIIRGARLHIGPDTGTVHMAWLSGTPSVSWYLNHESLSAWMPEGERHTVLVSAREQSRSKLNMKGITATNIIDAVNENISQDWGPESLKGDCNLRFIL